LNKDARRDDGEKKCSRDTEGLKEYYIFKLFVIIEKLNAFFLCE
jgi:hypothetical protein